MCLQCHVRPRDGPVAGLSGEPTFLEAGRDRDLLSAFPVVLHRLGGWLHASGLVLYKRRDLPVESSSCAIG